MSGARMLLGARCWGIGVSMGVERAVTEGFSPPLSVLRSPRGGIGSWE